MDPIIPVIVPYGRDITPELGVRETRARLAVAVRERLAASSGVTEGGGSMTPLSATERVRQVASRRYGGDEHMAGKRWRHRVPVAFSAIGSRR